MGVRGGSLSNRLGQLRSQRAPRPELSKPLINSSSSLFKDPWKQVAPLVWRREYLDPNPLKNLPLSGLLAPISMGEEEYLFYDTETTGLSSGAGTVPFLIGLGYIRGDNFITVQYFLEDHPGEQALLRLVAKEFQHKSLCISYNGKSYDKPLLESRSLFHRVPLKMGSQLDLLYPVRRLYKRTLENCRLGSCETFLLKEPRQGDIPGRDIPDIWFNFLKNRETAPLKSVFHHNYLDILSMAKLLAYLERLILNPLSPRAYQDNFALGKLLFEGDLYKKQGLTLLEQGVLRSDKRSMIYLSLHYKRVGEIERALVLWQTLYKRGLNLFAGIELAKYYEHQRKEYQRALDICNTLLSHPFIQIERGNTKRRDLLYRKKRLERKNNLTQ